MYGIASRIRNKDTLVGEWMNEWKLYLSVEVIFEICQINKRSKRQLLKQMINVQMYMCKFICFTTVQITIHYFSEQSKEKQPVREEKWGNLAH